MKLEPLDGAAGASRDNPSVTAAAGSIGRPACGAALDLKCLVRSSLRQLAVSVPRRPIWRRPRPLASVSDYLLKDMGVARSDVERDVRGEWFAR